MNASVITFINKHMHVLKDKALGNLKRLFKAYLACYE